MEIAMTGKTSLSHPGNLCCGKEGCATRGLGWFLPDPVTTQSEQDPIGSVWKLGHRSAQTGARGISGRDRPKAGGGLFPHRGKGISHGWGEMAECIGMGDNTVTRWPGPPALLGARKCPGTDAFDSVDPSNLPCLDSWISSKNSQGFLRDNIPLPNLPFLLSHISYTAITCIL